MFIRKDVTQSEPPPLPPWHPPPLLQVGTILISRQQNISNSKFMALIFPRVPNWRAGAKSLSALSEYFQYSVRLSEKYFLQEIGEDVSRPGSEDCTIYQELPSDSVTHTVSVQINHHPGQKGGHRTAALGWTNGTSLLLVRSVFPNPRGGLLR